MALHLYRAPDGCPLDDPAAWAAANPGIAAGIKSAGYMADEARRVLVTPADQASFRAFDLNQPQAPGRETVCTVADWEALLSEEPPPRSGGCCLGIDLGESLSMSGLVAVWPDTGRCEVFAAFADTPNLLDRGMGDAVGDLYARMHERGELVTYAGRIVPPGEFLKDCAARLAGERVLAAGADRFRRAAVVTALEAVGIRWPIVWRGQGASATADGSADVRAFQSGVLTGRLHPVESLVMASAIRESAVYRDKLGNPALLKHRANGRIDALSAWRDRCGFGRSVPASARVYPVGNRRLMSLHHLKIDNRRWAALRRAVFERDSYRCRSCGKAGRLECDHIRPLHKGGLPYDPANLQALCRTCHIRKTADENRQDPERQRWAAYLRTL